VFDLVIFDFDGVLVDSERLAVRTEVEVLAELGWPLREDEVIDRFVGRSAAHMRAEVQRALGREVDWESEFEARYREVFADELEAVAGVPAMLASLQAAGTSMCIASSSTHSAIAWKLSLVGLIGPFDGAVFSVEDVDAGKPAPDVFLHAASSMGVPPGRCAVVEDSLSGVEAGLAAQMSVFAYAGGVTPAARLALPGVTVFSRMDQLAGLLATAGSPLP